MFSKRHFCELATLTRVYVFFFHSRWLPLPEVLMACEWHFMKIGRTKDYFAILLENVKIAKFPTWPPSYRSCGHPIIVPWEMCVFVRVWTIKLRFWPHSLLMVSQTVMSSFFGGGEGQILVCFWVWVGVKLLLKGAKMKKTYRNSHAALFRII